MTSPDSQSIPTWKLVETMAVVGFALVVRAAVRIIDDRAMVGRPWADSWSLIRGVLGRSLRS